MRNCEEPGRILGMSPHPRSQHHGPLGGKSQGGRKAGLSSGELCISDVLAHTSPVAGCQCRVWHLYISPGGVPVWRIDGKPQGVRRLVWRLMQASQPSAMGPFPAGARLGTSCHTMGCINPAHLVCRTRSEVAKGRVLAPTHVQAIRVGRRLGAKITAQDVLQMHTSPEPRAVLAKRYHISVAHVGKILRGEVWRDVVPKPIAPTKPQTRRAPVPDGGNPRSCSGQTIQPGQSARLVSYERAMALARQMGFAG